MAELHVQPKKPNPWGLWLLLAIVALAILFFIFRGCNNKTADTTNTDSIRSSTDSDSAATATMSMTQPDWNSVDFNSPELQDTGITDKDISVRGNDRLTIYSLGENLLFAPNQSALQATADAKLRQIVASLNKRHRSAVIGVFGNTDSTGTAGHNKQLGAERAGEVRNWLVKTGGIDPGKVSVRSYGESQPVADNSTAGGRKQNRNVQIVVFSDNDARKL